MKGRTLWVFVALVALAALALGWYFLGPHVVGPNILESRLVDCGSIPNGTVRNVTETTRVFVNIPSDLYAPDAIDRVIHGAAANYISNGGPYGEAMDAQGRKDCWSTYFEFDLTPDNRTGKGSVDIVAESRIHGVPEYTIHFDVTRT